MKKKFKNEDGFWRVGSTEKTTDVDTWEEAKVALGRNLIAHPTSYHWMAFGWLDDKSDFVSKEGTEVEISW